MAPADDPYTVLGVARSATQAEIKAAYQTLVMKYHPDRHLDNPLADLASERVAEINRAYEVLSDPARRAAYDAGQGTSVRKPGTTGPVFKPVMALVALLLLLRLGASALPAMRMLLARLLGAVRAIGGGRVAAVVVLLAALTLVLAERRRRLKRRT